MQLRRERCEVCGAAAALPGLALDARVVLLCREHKRLAKAHEATSFEAVRALFIEESGRRALLSRRGPAERRLFPPRPEGRRHGQGRRLSDSE